jgi:hypothetical protein
MSRDASFHKCGNADCQWSSLKNIHGIEVRFDGKSFIFRVNDKAVAYDNIYMLEPQELAEKLGIDNEKALLARMAALQIFEDREIGVEELADILGLTIKHDEINKVITFLVMLSAFTNSDQLNLSFRAESSTGKSYIPLEVSALFPEDKVIKIAYSSPTAFFHERGKVDEETKEIVIDLQKKILIFLDQPHDQLLERLRPLLSHDQRELVYKITDKREKSGLRTKNVKIIGFPAVVFCTGKLRVDEQEATRMILLSPEVSQEKFREAIYLKILKEADEETFRRYVEENPERKALRERIKKIAGLNVREIIVQEYEKVYERFISTRKVLKPRHMRDASRVVALAKTLSLLNYMHRKTEKDGERLVIYVSEKDVDEAFKLWNKIAEPQEYNVSPFILQVYREVIQPMAKEKIQENSVGGPAKIEIYRKIPEVFGRPISFRTLDKEILPALESIGLITIESHPNDRRLKIVKPVTINGLYEEYTSPSESNFLSLNIGGRVKAEDLSRKLSPKSGVACYDSGGLNTDAGLGAKDYQGNINRSNVMEDENVTHTTGKCNIDVGYSKNEAINGISEVLSGIKRDRCGSCRHYQALRCLLEPSYTRTPTALPCRSYEPINYGVE